MPKTKIKPKSKKPSSQWEIVEDFKLIPMAQDGKKLTYQWSNQQPPSNYTLATPKDVNVSRTESNRKLTQKEIDQLAKYTAEQNQLKKEQEYNQRKQAIQQSIEAQKQPLTINNLRTQTQATGDKMSLAMNSRFGNPKEYPILSGYMDALDFINPGKFIGDMATGLGALPYNVREGNYGQAALALAVPLATGAIGSFGQKPAGSLFREQVYKAVDPVAYGMKEKLKSAPKTWLKNTLASDESKRALEIGKQLSNLNPEYFADDITKIGQNRLDAFRVGLKLPQKYDTFEQIAENTYRIKNMNPQVGEFSSVYNDLVANDYLKNATGVYSGENPLVTIAKKHDKLTSPTIKTEFGDYSVNDLRRYLMKEKDELPAWEQHRIVEKAKNPKFTHSVYDADRQGIMGSFRWDIKKPSFENDYKLHFQSNDLWNLNPFEKRGAISIKPKEGLNQFHFKPLENFEALSFVGGKPFNIQNNFVLDPKTYKILEKYKSGGKIKTDPKGYWNKDNHGNPVRILSNRITMQGVNQPLLGISDTGDMKMMYPNGEYQFQGNSVTEFPITMQQGGVTPKDELIKIDGEWHNQDIIDGLERGYRVEQRRWNSNLNRYGTVNEEEFYKKFPTEEHFILENQRRYANHIGSSRKYVPQDETLMRQGGQVRQPIKGTKEQYQAYQDSLTLYNTGQKNLNALNSSATRQDWLNYYRYYTNSPEGSNAVSAYNRLKAPVPQTINTVNGSVGLFKKPVQPIIYQPENSLVSDWNPQGRQTFSDDNGRVYYMNDSFNPVYKPKERPKEKPINIQSSKPDFLQGNNQQLEFNPIPFTKGTYFTRPRQRQEEGYGELVDYFDKKTGKLLGIYKNGGKVKNSDWEIIEDDIPMAQDGDLVLPPSMLQPVDPTQIPLRAGVAEQVPFTIRGEYSAKEVKEKAAPKYVGLVDYLASKGMAIDKESRKALAKTFRKMAKARKKEDGGYAQGEQYEMTDAQIAKLRAMGYKIKEV